MGVPGLPVTVLLDRDGDEIARMLGGADWTSQDARAIVAALIAAWPQRSGQSPPRLKAARGRIVAR